MRAPIRRHQTSSTHHLIKKNLFGPFGLVIWVSFCLFVSIGLWQSVSAMRQSLTREQQAKNRLKEEEKRTLELIEKLNKADTPFAKEKIIRDELQMQKPDETVIQIPKEN